MLFLLALLMSLPATDDFAGGAAALTGSWTQQKTTITVNRDGAGLAVSSNTGDEGFAFWDADAFANAQYSKAIIDTVATSAGYAQVTVCCSADVGNAAYDGYIIATDGLGGAGHCVLNKATNGTQVALRTYTTTFAAGDEIELRFNGVDTLEVFKNGVSQGTHTDASSTFVGGRAGVGVYGTAKLRSWEGGNLASFNSPLLSRGFHGSYMGSRMGIR